MDYIADLHTHSPYSRATSPRGNPERAGRLGAGQGNPGDRHRRLHPSRLVSVPQGGTGAGRAGAVPAEGRGGDRLAAAGGSAGSDPGPVSALGRDQQHLQTPRRGAQGPQPALRARFRLRRADERHPGGHRQHRVRRPPDPGAGQPRSAGDPAGAGAGGFPGAGPHLDPLVLPVRLQVRLRQPSRRVSAT